MTRRGRVVRRRGVGWRAWAVGAATLVAGWLGLPQGAYAQEETVARGHQAYQEGHYGAAIDAYTAVLDGGWVSAGLEYNLGNAYFKDGQLGPAILHWERALERAPGDEDVEANLELARSLTTDAVEPRPDFWLFSLVRWWVDLLPRGVLIGLVAGGWLLASGGFIARVLARSMNTEWAASWVMRAGLALVVVLGVNLVVRELGLGQPDRAIVMADVVPVRSAPADDDDLVLFEIHEGTRVRIDDRAGAWFEVVLDDGKVGWLPSSALEEI